MDSLVLLACCTAYAGLLLLLLLLLDGTRPSTVRFGEDFFYPFVFDTEAPPAP